MKEDYRKEVKKLSAELKKVTDERDALREKLIVTIEKLGGTIISLTEDFTENEIERLEGRIEELIKND